MACWWSRYQVRHPILSRRCTFCQIDAETPDKHQTWLKLSSRLHTNLLFAVRVGPWEGSSSPEAICRLQTSREATKEWLVVTLIGDWWYCLISLICLVNASCWLTVKHLDETLQQCALNDCAASVRSCVKQTITMLLALIWSETELQHVASARKPTNLIMCRPRCGFMSQLTWNQKSILNLCYLWTAEHSMNNN